MNGECKMKKYTQKQLREMVNTGIAINITNGTLETRKELLEKEDYLNQIGYASGLYGCNGKLLQGDKTGQWYVVIGHTQAIYIF
jgi:hypothetical protein